MQRNIEQLKTHTFDVLVIGAGIHGACIARDAALRGMSVALIDKGDLCGATSHNSLKTIHGGIRYLQHLNFKRTFESINEQKYWLRTAPHLVKPLPFLMPTYGHGARGPEAMWCGIKLYEMMGWRRNRSLPTYRRIPNGRIISAQECLALAPALDPRNLSGGAIWYDAQAENTDRAVIEIAQSAAQHGACVANYVQAEQLLTTPQSDSSAQRQSQQPQQQAKTQGIMAIDLTTSEEFAIKASLVVNASGPWAGQWLGSNQAQLKQQHALPLTKSMNIVTKQLLPEQAIGIKSQQQSDSVLGNSQRLYFIVPWKDCSMVGTTHFHYDGDINRFNADLSTTEQEINSFLAEINAAYPDAKLKLEDVSYCYQGLTPANEPSQHKNATRLHHSKIIDHENTDELSGLISVISIKWTSARLMAEKAVDLCAQKLSHTGKTFATCSTHMQALPNAEQPFPELDAQAQHKALSAFVKRAVNTEMTLSLSDLLLRRTDALMRNQLSADTIKILAQLLAKELDWTTVERHAQLEKLQTIWLSPDLKDKLTSSFVWGLAPNNHHNSKQNG